MFHPDDTFPVYLDDLPVDDLTPSRPTLFFRRGSAADDLAFDREVEAIKTRNLAGAELVESLVDLLKTRLVRAENTATDSVLDLMSTRDLRSLVVNLTALADLTESTAKKSVWPWSMHTAAPAETAAPADA